jgi:hypothetical protein
MHGIAPPSSWNTAENIKIRNGMENNTTIASAG